MTWRGHFSAKRGAAIAAALVALALLLGAGCKSAQEREASEPGVDLRSQALEWPGRDGRSERGPRKPLDQY